MGLRLVDFSLWTSFLLVQDSLVWVLDTLYPCNQRYPVLEKCPSSFELAVWELLFARLAWSEATSLTSVLFAKVRVSRLLAMLEISAMSRYPAVAALATASDMMFK